MLITVGVALSDADAGFITNGVASSDTVGLFSQSDTIGLFRE